MKIQNARRFRRESTPAEALLWRLLRNRQLFDHKFRRQQPIGPFIVDFCCLSARLVIELDGGQHAATTVQEERRTKWLLGQGYRVVRFWNHEVLGNPEGVFAQVGQLLNATGGCRPPLTRPLPLEKGAEAQLCGSCIFAELICAE